MYVKSVSVWGDAEADLVVTDGVHDCLAYCHPCTLAEGDEIEGALIVLETDGIYRTDEPVGIRQSTERAAHYAQRVVAEVVAVERGNGTVQTGELVLEVGPLPGDIVPGDRVVFEAWRLDV